MNTRCGIPCDCSPVRSLLEMPGGCKLRVEELNGSPSVRSRLYAMGILPGTEMELSGRTCKKGSVCVRVRGCSLVLGESMARSILCRTAGENEEHLQSRHGHEPWTLCNPFRGHLKKKGDKPCCGNA